MSINQRYIELVVAYLSVLEEEEIRSNKINGAEGYTFSCPFCSQFITTAKNPLKKTGHLVRAGGDSWKFFCTKGASNECRAKGGRERSLHNFLAMLNPDLSRRYRRDLDAVTTDRPFTPEQMGKTP